MKNNILIFRTDRIGDLLLTCPTIKTIKDNVPNSNIILVCSSFNYEYAKSFEFIDEVLIFPKKGMLNKIKFIMKLKKRNYEYVFIFDGKDRSILSSLFIKSKVKTAKVINNKTLLLGKIFSIKSEIDLFGKDLNYLHQKLLDKINLNIKINNFDYLIKKKDNNFASNIPIDNYVQIHLDEKWFNASYIKSYNEINPSFENFTNFINKISAKNNNLVITTGIKSNNLIERLILSSKNKINNKIFIYNIKENIFLINQPTFLDLESVLRKAKAVVTCHGALTHAAASFNLKIIDIVEESSDELVKRYSLYINNYYKVYRDNFNNLSQNILSKI